MKRAEPYPICGLLRNHGGESIEEEAGNPFAGRAFHPCDLEQARSIEFLHFLFLGVVLGENHSMVQVLIDPILDKVEFAKIDYKPVFIQLRRLEGEGYGPAMAMQASATAFVKRLAVGKGNVPVGFAAGDHARGSFFILRGIVNFCELKGFLSFHTSPAFSTMNVHTRITRPGHFKGSSELGAQPDQIGLGHVDERAVEA